MNVSRSASRRRVVLLSAVAFVGCTSIGTTKFYEDQLGYSRALGEGEKSATLLNVVRIRYGDAPTFLQPTQVISGYQLQQSVMGGFEVFPAANPSSFLTGTAGAQLQESPTFTFQPLSGEQFAQSSIRPFSAGDFLPLAMSGMPIDVLFRLGVQSINGYSNAIALTETRAEGSPEFFQILYDLRRLQVAGLVNIRLAQTHVGDAGELPPPITPVPAHPVAPAPAAQSTGFRGVTGLPPYVYLTLTPSTDPELVRLTDEVKRLMSIDPHANEVEVIYGRASGPGQVAMITRSILGVMSQLAIQIEVPPEDVTRHRTLPTVGNVGVERRPVVIIHYRHRDKPENTFTAARYGENIFWIDNDDFDSKLAFTVLQVLLALARSGGAPGAVVSVPAH